MPSGSVEAARGRNTAWAASTVSMDLSTVREADSVAGNAVSLTARINVGMLELAVTDTGEGIAAAQLPHVFERFFQATRGSRAARHGAGLGLPIASGIVEAHGGRISIESSLGVGTTVKFTLPLARRPAVHPD